MTRWEAARPPVCRRPLHRLSRSPYPASRERMRQAPSPPAKSHPRSIHPHYPLRTAASGARLQTSSRCGGIGWGMGRHVSGPVSLGRSVILRTEPAQNCLRPCEAGTGPGRLRIGRRVLVGKRRLERAGPPAKNLPRLAKKRAGSTVKEMQPGEILQNPVAMARLSSGGVAEKKLRWSFFSAKGHKSYARMAQESHHSALPG